MSNCYVNVCGGLGNQLFQVATGFAYSKMYDKDLYINDSGWFAHQGNHPENYKTTIFKNFEYSSPSVTKNIIPIFEKTTSYSKIPYIHGDVCLNGYFQSIKYFEPFLEEFKSKLYLPYNDYSKCNILNKNNVAFHIRRGDYLSFKDIHYVCDTEYFNKFFKFFEDYNINVFTDSPEYVLDEFKTKKFNLIKTSSDLIDLTLMSLHNNMVCSNSSFSWWASILGTKKHKIFVPNKWFSNNLDGVDIYRKDMIIL